MLIKETLNGTFRRFFEFFGLDFYVRKLRISRQIFVEMSHVVFHKF